MNGTFVIKSVTPTVFLAEQDGMLRQLAEITVLNNSADALCSVVVADGSKFYERSLGLVPRGESVQKFFIDEIPNDTRLTFSSELTVPKARGLPSSGRLLGTGLFMLYRPHTMTRAILIFHRMFYALISNGWIWPLTWLKKRRITPMTPVSESSLKAPGQFTAS